MRNLLASIATRTSGLMARLKGHSASLVSGQLNNPGFEKLFIDVLGTLAVKAQNRTLNIVEIGTGSGRGSTESLYRAVKSLTNNFTLQTYECDESLFQIARNHWKAFPEVTVINEFFMRGSDIEGLVKNLILPVDRESYLQVFSGYRDARNFFKTEPPKPVDFFFIDTVRYTHLAAIKLAMTLATSDTLVLMEDDIPDYGESRILKEHTHITNFQRHPVEGCMWPFVLFKLK